MTYAAAIQDFFSGFEIPAYSSTAYIEDEIIADVENHESGYLTHDFPLAGFGDGDVSGTVFIRYFSESEVTINAKAEEIFKAIGRGGKFLHCDGGIIWLKRGMPFAVKARQEDGSAYSRYLKTRQLNITAEYLTIN